MSLDWFLLSDWAIARLNKIKDTTRIIQPGTTDNRVHTSIDSTTESNSVLSQIPKDRDADIPKKRARGVMRNTFNWVFLIIRRTWVYQKGLSEWSAKGLSRKLYLSHCFATHLMDAGVGIRYIQGIKTSKTTLIYTCYHGKGGWHT